MKDTPQRFSHITISLHWLVGLTIIGLLAVGLYMANLEKTGPEDYALYPIHKSVGVIIFAFVLIRAVWRLMNGWPVPTGNHQAWEIGLAKVSHWVLLLGSILMPLSGITMSAAGGHGVAVFGIQLIAPTDDKIPALAGLAHEAHEIIGFILIATVILHVAGALKHHVLDGDGTLKRMLGVKVG